MKIEKEIMFVSETPVRVEGDYVTGENNPKMNIGIMDSGIKPNNLSTKSYFPFLELAPNKRITHEKFGTDIIEVDETRQ